MKEFGNSLKYRKNKIFNIINKLTKKKRNKLKR